jgi:RHS repeat-associated protein
LRALLVALACALLPAPAHASLPSVSDVARLGDELHGPAPLLAADLARELPKPCAGPFCAERAQPKTRVRGLELGLHCRVGGEAGLSCAPRLAYGFAYGERTSERSVYTGHYLDSETRLYFAKARYLDPQFGRFITADSYLGQADDPPSLHRYAYSANRPTYYVDPTGHFNVVGSHSGSQWGTTVNTVANFGWEFYKESWNVGLNIASLGAFGSAKEAYERGDSVIGGGAAGVLNTVTLGGAKGAVDAWSDGRSAVGGYVGGVAETFLPISEAQTLASDRASGWEKAQAIATGATKLATLGLALKAPVAKGAPRPVQIVETTSEVLATETRALPAARQPAGLLAAGEGASQTRFVADASGNIRDLTAGRGNLNPIGSAGPIELGPAPRSGPTAGFGRYVEAESNISRLPQNQVEMADQYRLNAAIGDIRARQAGIPRTSGRFGTRAHSVAEAESQPLAAQMPSQGPGVGLSLEEFRDSAGNIVGRRAPGSLGVDAVIYESGQPVRGLDLKTGRGWSAAQLKEIERRFGIRVTQIHTGN